MKQLLLATLALFSAAISAAPQPNSGTLNETTGALTFKGGPFIVSNPASDRVYLGDSEGRPVLVCEKEAMNCDRFALTVKLPEKFRENAVRQKQVLRFQLSVQERQPLPLVKPEFHLYVFDASGKELGQSTDSALNSALEEHLDLPLKSVANGSYTVVVTGYNGLGASYSAGVGLGPSE